MKNRHSFILAATAALTALSGSARSADADKDALKIPDGLAFSEFEGYEGWPVVSISHPTGGEGMSGETLNVIVANPVMMKAYAAGIPSNGKPFPDGAKAVKIQYIPKQSAEAPFTVAIPSKLKDVAFMVKDMKRFPDSGGWGYGLFNFDTTTNGFIADGTGAKCGATCHTIAKTKDFVFTEYQRR